MDLSLALETSRQDYESQLSLLPDAKEELKWWDTQMKAWNGRALLKQDIDLTIDSDASLRGWGAAQAMQQTGGLWSVQERKMQMGSPSGMNFVKL